MTTTTTSGPRKQGIRRLPHPYQPSYHAHQAAQVLESLLCARMHAREAGSPYTLARINAAISSARGAVRNAGYRTTRTARTEVPSTARARTGPAGAPQA